MSPASSIEKHMAELTESALSQQSSPWEQLVVASTTYAGDALLLARFSPLLQQKLNKAITLITADLKGDLQSIGEHLDTIEPKMDGTELQNDH